MEKKVIGFADFLLGAIVKFKEVDFVDIELLYELLEKDHLFLNDKESTLNPFICFRDGFYLGRGESCEEREKAISFMEKEQTIEVKTFFAKLSVYDFLLRKISRLGVVKKESLSEYGVCQLSDIGKLVQEGLLQCSEADDCFPVDFQEILLTPPAYMKLFLTDYAQEVKSFKQLLDSKGYNVVLFPLFLLNQDFSRSVEKILTIENFIMYCNTNNWSMYKESTGVGQKKDDFGLKKVFPTSA